MTYVFCIISKLDSYVKLNLFPSPYLPSKEFSSQKLILYSKRLLEEYQAWSIAIDLDQKVSKEPAITQLVANQLYLAKPKVRNDRFLINFKDAYLRELLSKCWSRVKVISVNEEEKGTIKLFYCDFGFESVVMSKDLAICPCNPMNRLTPRFTYECILNNDELISKLAVARSENDFVDFNYLNDRLDYSFLSQIPLKVDFTESLEKLNEMSRKNFCVVSVYDRTSNQNIIDLVIKNSLIELKNHIFPCIVSHINTVNDFYIQKVDPVSEQALTNLHEEIQNKVANNQLKKLESTEVCLNKLCVSIYHEDKQYYRAKITAIYNSERMVIYVFFLSTVKLWHGLRVQIIIFKMFAPCSYTGLILNT